MSNNKFISPQELFEKGKEIMLDGKEPSSQNDWVLIINFFAMNIHIGSEKPVCQLMKLIYDIPLSDKYIDDIILFQVAKKQKYCEIEEKFTYNLSKLWNIWYNTTKLDNIDEFIDAIFNHLTEGIIILPTPEWVEEENEMQNILKNMFNI